MVISAQQVLCVKSPKYHNISCLLIVFYVIKKYDSPGTLNNESVGATPRKRVVKRPAAQKAKERGTTKIANIGKNQTVEALTDR